MKHSSILLSILILFFTQNLSAQSLSDSVALMYKQYYEVSQYQANLLDSLTTDFGEVSSKVENMSNELSMSLNQVNNLTQNDLLTKEFRLRTQREKLMATSRFLRAATNSFSALDAALAQSDYLNEVTLLNSPTNKDLGFSLNEEIVTLLDEKIIKNNPKFNDKNPGKFRAMVKAVVENPITTTLTSGIPALSSIGAVMDLVTVAVAKEKDTSVEDFKSFKQGLQRYTSHYDDLAKASIEFNSNIDNLKVKTDALRSILTDFTSDRISTLNPAAGKQSITSSNFAFVLSSFYRPEVVDREIKNIIRSHSTPTGSVNYQNVLNENRLSYPLYAINQAQFIQQELDRLTNQYVSNYIIYHQRLQKILARSKSLSKDPTKVDKKLDSLNGKLERLVLTFRNNVKINEVNMYLREIPAY